MLSGSWRGRMCDLGSGELSRELNLMRAFNSFRASTMATTLAMLESKAVTAEKLILMLRQQIGEARAAQVVKTSNFFFVPIATMKTKMK